MIRHIVLVRFRDDVSEKERQAALDGLGKLKERLPGILAFHRGPNVSVEGELMRGITHAFWFDFKDAGARQAYLDDEEHRRLGGALAALAQGGIDGITVVDVEA